MLVQDIHRVRDGLHVADKCHLECNNRKTNNRSRQERSDINKEMLVIFSGCAFGEQIPRYQVSLQELQKRKATWKASHGHQGLILTPDVIGPDQKPDPNICVHVGDFSNAKSCQML